MTVESDQDIMDAAVAEAIALGATIAGYLPAARLIGCPSARADGNRGFQTDQGTYLILGLYHDPARPEMDFWEEGRGTPGDRILEGIGTSISSWFRDTRSVEARTIPYQLYDGGIYLKDAACLAGIGAIGRNNLVLVPGFGPRIRFRAVWCDLVCDDRDHPDLVTPCSRCADYCITSCPMDAFRFGSYSRSLCMARMDADKKKPSSPGNLIDHCRICELVCPDPLPDQVEKDASGY